MGSHEKLRSVDDFMQSLGTVNSCIAREMRAAFIMKYMFAQRTSTEWCNLYDAFVAGYRAAALSIKKVIS